jgi:sugar O-acyltransferase (sialic acid O-acetyltransferase NeuD family)
MLTMREPIVIFGAGGHARVVIDAVEKQGRYEILGLLARQPAGLRVGGYAVLGDESVLPSLLDGIVGGVVAVGDNHVRRQIVQRATQLAGRFQFVAVVHPSAIIGARVSIGGGAVVLAGSVINPDATLGDHCIVNTNSSLDHDSILSEFASLAPHVATGGNVTIGRGSAICIGAKISHGISIGENCVIGAGSTVLEDLPTSVLAYGSPCRIIRERIQGEQYL